METEPALSLWKCPASLFVVRDADYPPVLGSNGLQRGFLFTLVFIWGKTLQTEEWLKWCVCFFFRVRRSFEWVFKSEPTSLSEPLFVNLKKYARNSGPTHMGASSGLAVRMVTYFYWDQQQIAVWLHLNISHLWKVYWLIRGVMEA